MQIIDICLLDLRPARRRSYVLQHGHFGILGTGCYVSGYAAIVKTPQAQTTTLNIVTDYIVHI